MSCMVSLREALNRVLSPGFYAPLMVAAVLVILCGLFNVLYTAVNSPQEFLAASSRIGPTPSRSIQNISELLISLMSYSMMMAGCYLLYTVDRYSSRRSMLRYSLVLGNVLIVIGLLMIMSLYAQKSG